jgi:hypothetical protein
MYGTMITFRKVKSSVEKEIIWNDTMEDLFITNYAGNSESVLELLEEYKGKPDFTTVKTRTNGSFKISNKFVIFLFESVP